MVQCELKAGSSLFSVDWVRTGVGGGYRSVNQSSGVELRMRCLRPCDPAREGKLRYEVGEGFLGSEKECLRG